MEAAQSLKNHRFNQPRVPPVGKIDYLSFHRAKDHPFQPRDASSRIWPIPSLSSPAGRLLGLGASPTRQVFACPIDSLATAHESLMAWQGGIASVAANGHDKWKDLIKRTVYGCTCLSPTNLCDSVYVYYIQSCANVAAMSACTIGYLSVYLSWIDPKSAQAILGSTL